MKFCKKLFGVCSFMVAALPLYLSAAQQSQITTNNITFYFDKAYEVGQFVSGDWWVLPHSAGGTVHIVKFDPSPYSSGCTKTGHDGWEVNPEVDARKQAFDKRRLTWEPARMPCLPYHAKAHESIVKSKSWDRTNKKTMTCLSDVAVLTVLAERPPADAFRPPYIKGVKPLFRTSDLDLSPLAKLPAVKQMPKLADVHAMWGGPVLDHWTNPESRRFHAKNNIKNLDGSSANYGAAISRTTGLTILRSMHQESDAEKVKVIIPVLQWGIDLYYMLSQYKPNMYWKAWGGHFSGRKLPILFTGLLLNNKEMLNVGKDYTTRSSCDGYFGEDGQTYYGANGEALWGQAGDVCGCEGKYGGEPKYSIWMTVDPVCNKQGAKGKFSKKPFCRDPAGLVDGGSKSRSSDGKGECRAINTLEWQRKNKKWEASSYQECCTSGPWIGTHIAALLLGLKDEWNHDAFFDYMDRWMSPPWNGRGFYGQLYFNVMYARYRSIISLPQPERSITLPPEAEFSISSQSKDETEHIIISFSESIEDSQVIIYPASGGIVRELQADKKSNVFVWDKKTLKGKKAKPGIYFYSVKINGKQVFGKLVSI